MLGKISKFFRENQILFLILGLAAAFRLVLISDVPPSLNWDEVSHGYNAYSILKTGKDEWGESFPAIFRAYGDYKLPVYIYATAIFELFFGLTAFAVRLPSVLAGIATVLFTYLLTKKLFERKVAILAAFLVAIEPWSFFLSRVAVEANFSLALITAGVYFFLVAIEKPKYFIPSAVLLGLSVWTYNSARVFVPALLILLAWLYREELAKLFWKEKKLFGTGRVILALFFIPMFWQLINPVGQARYGAVAILDEGKIAQINEARVKSQLPPLGRRLVYNKVTFFTGEVVKNWFSHFSPEFLFLKGGTHYQFSVPDYGLLYAVNLPLFLIGLLWLFKKKDKRALLVLGWLALAPIPSSLTREAPHVLRSITMLPVPMIMTAVGGVVAWDWLKGKKHSRNVRYFLVAAYIVFLGALMEGYIQNYFGDYKKAYSWSWQYGYKEVVSFVKDKYEEYDTIIVSKKYGEPHEFFLFYGAAANAPWSWHPEDYRNDPNLIRFHQSNWYWVDRFDRFYFVNDWEVPKEGHEQWRMESGGEVPLLGKSLLITSPGNYSPGWQKLKTISFLDGELAFDILER